jgi:hypothetical protein
MGSLEYVAFVVSQTHYIFISHDPHMGIVTCTNCTLVKLCPWCMARLQMHMATAPKDISQMIPSVITMWPDDPAKLLTDVNLTYRTEIKGWPLSRRKWQMRWHGSRPSHLRRPKC